MTTIRPSLCIYWTKKKSNYLLLCKENGIQFVDPGSVFIMTILFSYLIESCNADCYWLGFILGWQFVEFLLIQLLEYIFCVWSEIEAKSPGPKSSYFFLCRRNRTSKLLIWSQSSLVHVSHWITAIMMVSQKWGQKYGWLNGKWGTICWYLPYLHILPHTK